MNRELTDQCSDNILIFRPDGVITYANKAVARLLGYSPEELVGRNRLDLSHPEDRGAAAEPIQKLLDGLPSVRSGRYRFQHKDGSWLWIESTISNLLADPDGRSIVSNLQDVTARKTAEDVLREDTPDDRSGESSSLPALPPIVGAETAEATIQELKTELETRVRRRTTELEAANRELESFCYSVSHDLRAPLRGISGFIRAVLEDYGEQLSPEALHYLERASAASHRMGHLIDALLRLSQIVRRQMRRQSVDLSAIVWEIAVGLQSESDDRLVKFDIAEDRVVEGDPDLLRVLMDNLVRNAWKFTRGRELAVIEFGCQDQDGEAVYFLRDNGAGFDMAYSSKLFGAFQRLHSPQEFEGTGIGLATVQRIIARHGGRIWAEGQVDAGATFYFTLDGVG